MIAMKARSSRFEYRLRVRGRFRSVRPPFVVFIQRLAGGAAKRGNRVRFRCTGGRASRFRVAGYADRPRCALFFLKSTQTTTATTTARFDRP